MKASRATHVGVDDVASVRDSPGDGVEEPEGREDDGRGGEGLAVVGTEAADGGLGVDEEDLPDAEQGEATETEPNPLMQGGEISS